MFKKIIWALLEIATIGSGTYTFVSTMVNEDYVDHKAAGIGGFLIASGLLLRNWRLTLFIKEENKDSSKMVKSEVQNKTTNTLVILILCLTAFGLYRKISSSVSNNETEIQSIETKLSDEIEYRLDNVETFEERIENLENHSHRHY
jgi:hypothetical protein